MDEAPVTHLSAGIPTRDFESALGRYERLLGRSPDRFPHDTEAVWQLADTGLIYRVADSRRAGNAIDVCFLGRIPFTPDPMSGARELARERRGLIIAVLVPIQVTLAILAWRDLSRRADSQVRGRKGLWRVFVLLNPGNAMLYWLFGRR